MPEACGLPYTVVPVNIGKHAQFAPNFLKVSPHDKTLDIACYAWTLVGTGDLKEPLKDTLGAVPTVYAWLARAGERPSVTRGMEVQKTRRCESPPWPGGKGGDRSMARSHAVRRIDRVDEDITMTDGTKPDDLPPADDGAGLPTPPSPGRLPPPHLPPPDERDPASDDEGAADGE